MDSDLSHNDLDLIEKHLTGTLSQAEQSLFEQKVKGIAFRKELAFQQGLFEVIHEGEELAMKEVFLEEEKKIRQQRTAVTPKRKAVSLKWWGLAAAVLALIVAVFFLLPKGGSINSGALFAENFQAPRNTLSETQRGPSIDENDLRLAMDLYNNGEFGQAALSLERLLQRSGKPDNDISFYIAVSLLADGQTEESIPLLESIDKDDSATYRLQVDWYLGLAYLSVGKIDNAKEKFSAIANGSSLYKKDVAKNILKKMGE